MELRLPRRSSARHLILVAVLAFLFAIPFFVLWNEIAYRVHPSPVHPFGASVRSLLHPWPADVCQLYLKLPLTLVGIALLVEGALALSPGTKRRGGARRAADLKAVVALAACVALLIFAVWKHERTLVGFFAALFVAFLWILPCAAFTYGTRRAIRHGGSVRWKAGVWLGAILVVALATIVGSLVMGNGDGDGQIAIAASALGSSVPLVAGGLPDLFASPPSRRHNDRIRNPLASGKPAAGR